MPDSKDQSSIPMSRAEAEAYERPVRRQMYIGLGLGFAVLVVIIITIMEMRFRAGLGQPQPSELFDRGLSEVVAEAYPLPVPALQIHVETNRDVTPASYEVSLNDEDGRLLYRIARPADNVFLLDYGARSGEPMRYVVDLKLDHDGTVTGLYKQDRGVPVIWYQTVLQNLVREALMGFHAHASHPLDYQTPDEEPSTRELREDWEAAMD